MKYHLIGIGLLLIIAPATFAASFDCSKATQALDKMICQNPNLSQADSELADIYHSAMQITDNKITLKKSQQEWLKIRDNCLSSTTPEICLLHTYQERTTQLYKVAKNNADSPDLKQKTDLAKKSDNVITSSKYPIWVSPYLKLTDISPEGIDTALKQSFWESDFLKYLFPQQIAYLKNYYEVNEEKYKDNQKDASNFNCEQFSFEQFSIDGENVDSHLSRSQFLPYLETYCQVLKLLKLAKPAKNSYIHDFSLLQPNLESIMPGIVNLSEGPCFSDQYSKKIKENDGGLSSIFGDNSNYSWDYYLKKTGTGAHIAWDSLSKNYGRIYVEPTSSNNDIQTATSLHILAKGDFTGDGMEQILLSSEVQDGDIALYILYRNKNEKILKLLHQDSYHDSSIGKKPDFAATCDTLYYQLTNKTFENNHVK